MADSQSRKWQITINNPIEHGWTHDKIKLAFSEIKDLGYWCMCDEVGLKEHTHHTHVFIYRKNTMRFSKIKKTFPEAHIESAKGTCIENRDYIRKEGKYETSNKTETNLRDTFEEFGECPKEEQGKRTDLETLYDFIKDGYSDFQILEENPNYMKRLNDIQRVREVMRYEQFKHVTRELHVEYWSGKGGVGKTSGVFKQYGYENVYRVTDFMHPWDGYRGQDVVLFDDFISSNYEISKLLIWLDIYPLELPCRYNNKTACYTKVIFTSNFSLDSQYTWIQRDNKQLWEALLRRIHCVKVFDENGHITDYKNMDDYIKRYSTDKDGFIQLSLDQMQEIDDIFGLPPK
jgi:hypothetical protein